MALGAAHLCASAFFIKLSSVLAREHIKVGVLLYRFAGRWVFCCEMFVALEFSAQTSTVTDNWEQCEREEPETMTKRER